jgi:hypothetical protein
MKPHAGELQCAGKDVKPENVGMPLLGAPIRPLVSVYHQAVPLQAKFGCASDTNPSHTPARTKVMFFEGPDTLSRQSVAGLNMLDSMSKRLAPNGAGYV